MTTSADFSLNTKIVNDDSCSYVENNHSTYFCKSGLAHQANTQPQSISAGKHLEKDKRTQMLAVKKMARKKQSTSKLVFSRKQKVEIGQLATILRLRTLSVWYASFYQNRCH